MPRAGTEVLLAGCAVASQLPLWASGHEHHGILSDTFHRRTPTGWAAPILHTANVSYSVSMQGSVMLVEFTGAVSFQDLMGVTKAATTIEGELGRAPDRIVDLTGVSEMLFGYAELSALAHDRGAMRIPNRYRIIMVASTDVSYGVARIFQTLATHADIDIAMVPTRSDAAALTASKA